MSDKIKVKIESWGVGDYKPGDTAEVEPSVARMLIAGGNATPSEPEPEPEGKGEAKSSGKSSSPAT